MNADILRLFEKHLDALPLYEAVERHILDAFPDTTLKVGGTQVSFSDRYGFAYAWPPTRRVKGCPALYVGLTFGLGHREEHPRILRAVEPYPGRWTHHTIIADAADLDDLVKGWLRQAHTFSLTKGRKKR